MTIREKVARAIQFPDRGRIASIKANAIAGVAIAAFLEAAAEKGWRLVPDEATEEMNESAVGIFTGTRNKLLPHAVYRAMLADAPEFEVDG